MSKPISRSTLDAIQASLPLLSRRGGEGVLSAAQAGRLADDDDLANFPLSAGAVADPFLVSPADGSGGPWTHPDGNGRGDRAVADEIAAGNGENANNIKIVPPQREQEQIAGAGRRKSEARIVDFISGIEIPETPEEVHATQVFSMELVQSFGFKKEQIITRPQFRVSARPSDLDSNSRTQSDGFPIDIAIFDDITDPERPALFAPVKSPDDLRIVVECKQPDKKEGRKQLEAYLSMSSAEIGVWFNGQERLVIRKTFDHAHGNRLVFVEIPSLPRRGQDIATIGKHKKGDLAPAHNLKNILVRIRNHIAGNAIGTTRDEAIATEIINLIFCKVHDEKTKADAQQVDFRAEVGEGARSVTRRIKDLFASMKTAYQGVFTAQDTISLDDASILYVVGELQQHGLLRTQRDIVADAFEVFIGPSLKGAQGQFFTPRNAVSIAIQLLNVGMTEKVIDPACGSGGFLVEVLARKWALIDEEKVRLGWDDATWSAERTRIAAETIFGIEKDAFLAKVAKAYMAIMGDGRGGIFCENTLAARKSWKSAARIAVWGPDEETSADGLFDVVVANPPYGEDIRIKDPVDLAQFAIAATKGVSSKKGVRPDILFIERCLQLLRPGGRMAIVLIETFFHAPDSKPVLDLIRQGNNVSWVVDLPHNTFRPHCNAKTVIVVVEKGVAQQEKINFAVAEQMGHDHRGEPIYRRDKDGNKTNVLWDDLGEISAEIEIARLTSAISATIDRAAKARMEEAKERATSRWPTRRLRVFAIDEPKVRASGVYVPRFHSKNLEEEITERSRESKGGDMPFDLVRLQDIIDDGSVVCFDGHGSPESHFKGMGELPYIRVDDVVGWSLYKNPVSGVPEALYATMVEDLHVRAMDRWRKSLAEHAAGKGKSVAAPKEPIDKRPKSKDILFVRRGSYRIGSVAIVSPHDGKMILTRELLTLRVIEGNKRGITPEYLLFALSHPLVQQQLGNKVLIDTTLPNIGDRWKTLLIPFFSGAEKTDIETRIGEALKRRWESDALLASLAVGHGKLVM